MASVIRDYTPADEDAVVALALEIWDPVFASVNGVLGPELALRLHGADWRDHQARDVRDILRPGPLPAHAWLAEDSRNGSLVGFAAAAVVDPRRHIGELRIVGVAPREQRGGLGTELVGLCRDWMRAQGMRVAYLSTGGDAGHAPARALYERTGFTLFPSAQYFAVLEPTDAGNGRAGAASTDPIDPHAPE